MNTPTPDSQDHDKPTPDDLAGIPVSREEDQPIVPVRASPGIRVRGPGRKRGGGAQPASPPQELPTADDLAGIPVTGEGEENTTVRPWSPPRRQ